MADFKRSMQILKRLEFSDTNDCLHQNKTENGLTYWGIMRVRILIGANGFT